MKRKKKENKAKNKQKTKKLKTKQTKELNRRNSLMKKTSSKHTQTVQQIEKKVIKPNRRGKILLNKI
jgi:hypothetical protein